MGKDYAHRRKKPAGNKNQPRAKHKPVKHAQGLPSWLWGLLGLTAGLLIAAIAFIALNPVEPEVAEAQPAAPAPKAQAEAPQIPPKETARFKFYDGLKEAEVRPSEETYRVETPPPPEQDKSRYLIQAGSFRAREDAETRKANLALIGIESQIKAVSLQDKGTRYRVQIGPALSRIEAEKTMSQLREHKIDSFATRVSG